MKPAVFQLRTEVTQADLDELGHVNNLVYLRWVQEAATAHWRAEASGDLQRRITWVVVRHEIDYHVAALEGDGIVLRTWVDGGTRTTSDRHTEILREGDGALLAKARTVWCPLAASSGRPVRVSDALPVGFLEDG